MRRRGDVHASRLSITESGIGTRMDVEKLEAAGYDGFLIGETLMRNDNPEKQLRELTGR
ncbi:MAG: hypothetical protein R6V03_07755 [Kiritimatiellia bacterium]